jgi:hypothetical protein
MHEIANSTDVILNAITHIGDWQCTSTLCGGLTMAFQYLFQNRQLTLQSQVDINGSYTTARAIGSFDHIVTNARIDTWGFTGPLYRCNQDFYNFTNAEYREAAQGLVNETVTEYASSIIGGLAWANDVAFGQNSCKHGVQISSMTNNDESLSDEEKSSIPLFGGQGMLQNFVQVTSMDTALAASISAPAPREVATMPTEASGAFIAYSNSEIYATASDLVLACRGWRYDNESQWDEYTYFMSFDLSGSSATPKAVGEVPGYLKNQFSMDMYQKSLRVATTSFQKWGRVEDEEGNTSWQLTTNSTSQVSVLQANDSTGGLDLVGFVGDLGPAEDIKSVRFLQDRGYVVTFRTVDPLYSLDLSDPNKPKMKGELKISGVFRIYASDQRKRRRSIRRLFVDRRQGGRRNEYGESHRNQDFYL